MKPYNFGIDELPGILELVHGKLKNSAPENIGGIKRLLWAQGKRLRPSLVIAVAFYSGKKIDSKVMNAATAVELVHLASLIHDDIIDGGKLRWNVPTINSVEGIDQAIIAGDYLLAKGCELACNVSAETGALMAETIANLCVGQAEEHANQFNTERTVESCVTVAEGKTSSLFITSCLLGGLISNMNQQEIGLLRDFGNNFGIYFQLMDDIIDFIDTPETTGKTVGNDISKGTYTLPVVLSLQGPHKTRLKTLLKNSNSSASQILEILKKDDSVQRAMKEAESFKQKALFVLKSLENNELAKALDSFISQFDHLKRITSGY